MLSSREEGESPLECNDPVVEPVETSTKVELCVNENEGLVLGSPPCYNAVDNDPPPSYNNIFGHLASIKDNSQGPTDTLRQSATAVGDLVGGSLVVTGCMLLMLALPIASIIMGGVYLNDCPIERLIPIYLIVSGVFCIVKTIDSIFSQCMTMKRKREGIEEDQSSKKASAIGGIVGCFLTVWFICGNVWIYSNYKTVSYLSGSKYYCNQSLYLFAFWTTTAAYILALLFCFLACCGMCVACCCSSSNTVQSTRSNGGG